MYVNGVLKYGGPGIRLLSLGLAERDGAMIFPGCAVALLSAAYVAGLIWLASQAGRNAGGVFDVFKDLRSRLTGA